MSEENVQRLRQSLDANQLHLRTRDFDIEAAVSSLAELWDPEIEMDTSELVLDMAGVYRGMDAVRLWWREWYGTWEVLPFEYELVDAGDRVVVLVDMQVRGRSSGLELPTGKYAWVATFRDGLIVHMKFYVSQSEALQAVGVSE